MNIKKIPIYLKGIARSLSKARPRDLLKVLSNSPYIIEEIDEHGFSIILSVRDPAISKPLLCIQQYERNVTQTLLKYMQDDTHFLDIGANIGFFSLLAAKRCPHGHVWSFEPDPHNFNLFKSSIALNQLDQQIHAYQLAASNKEETLGLSNLGYADNLGSRFTAKESSTLKNRSINQNATYDEIHAVCLDQFLENERIDLIKVDIEGYEPFAFQGMQRLIQKNRPTIITEFAPGTIEHISQTNPVDLLKFFNEADYKLSIIEANGNIIKKNVDQIMDYFMRARTHHVDLLLEPRQPNSSFI